MEVLASSLESSRSLPARLKIIETAERLYALHGIDAVSIREINKAAGQRNGSAVQYHFGNREGLIEAIFALRTRARNNQRFLMLHRLKETAGPAGPALRDVVEVMVVPMFEGLRIGQRSYQGRFIKQVHQRHATIRGILSKGYDMGLRECFRLIRDQHTQTPMPVLTRRYVHGTAIALDAAALLEELIEQGDPAPTEADMRFHLACCIDSITALYQAPVSDALMTLAPQVSNPQASP
jgi:AcrR family transcriptional regulator